MNKEYLIRVISCLFSNTLHREESILRDVENEADFLLTAYKNITTGDINGCIQWNETSISFCSCIEKEEYTLIIGDLNTKEMTVYKGYENENDEVELEEVDFGDKCSNGIIDLNFDGCRWEGGILKGKNPHGYGVFYDEEDRVESECFVYEGKRTCYNKEYYAELSQMKYKGGYGVDCRCGKGKSLDRNEDDDYEGLWYGNYPVGDVNDKSNIRLPLLHNRLSHLSISSTDLTDNDIRLFVLDGCLVSLQELQIGNDSLNNICYFELNGLPNLTKLIIGDNCGNGKFDIGEDDDVMETFFSIRNCPKLCRIIIGDNSFTTTQLIEFKGK